MRLVLPGALLFMIPLLWMLSTALKEPKQIFIFPPQWIPKPSALGELCKGWNDFLPFNRFLLNSLIITTNNIVGNLISCCLAAFAFARLRARGKNFFFVLVLGTMLLPTEVTIIPQYVLFSKLGWNNTWLPLMIPSWFGWAFFIFLLRQFFMGIPRELDEAARLDGASSWHIMWHVVIPLAKPALATVVIFGFIGNWNNFLQPLDLHSIHRYAGAGGGSQHVPRCLRQHQLQLHDGRLAARTAAGARRLLLWPTPLCARHCPDWDQGVVA